jgi:hypothetical protein
MPTNPLYHTWFQRIRELRPLQRITQICNFTWLIVGIFLSRSVHLSKVAGKIPGSAKLVSITGCVIFFREIIKINRPYSTTYGKQYSTYRCFPKISDFFPDIAVYRMIFRFQSEIYLSFPIKNLP